MHFQLLNTNTMLLNKVSVLYQLEADLPTSSAPGIVPLTREKPASKPLTNDFFNVFLEVIIQR